MHPRHPLASSLALPTSTAIPQPRDRSCSVPSSALQPLHRPLHNLTIPHAFSSVKIPVSLDPGLPLLPSPLLSPSLAHSPLFPLPSYRSSRCLPYPGPNSGVQSSIPRVALGPSFICASLGHNEAPPMLQLCGPDCRLCSGPT